MTHKRCRCPWPDYLSMTCHAAAGLQDALASLPDLDRALTALEGRVSVLEAGSRQLATQLGLKPGVSASTVMGAFSNMLQRG